LVKLAFCALALAFAVEGSAQVRVIESGPQRLRLTWEPAASEMAWGRGALVGLPPTGDIRLEVIEARIARTDIADDDVEPMAGPAFLGRTGRVRSQRVAELAFGPRVEADRTRTLYDRVVVDVHLTGGGGSSRVADKWGEDFYRRVLINPDQARNWRLSPKKRPARKSAVQDGSWLRVSVLEEGMYQIAGSDLAEAGIALDGVDPASLRLRYGGGEALPILRVIPPIALEERALVVEDGGDGRFDADDFVLFWAEPVNRWEYDRVPGEYEHRQNLYTRENIYWLGFGGGAGMRPETRSGALVAAEPHRPETYRVRVHEEAEQFILAQTYGIKSGYSWYWEDFRGNARNFPLVVRQAADEPVDIRLAFYGVAKSAPSFAVRWNNEAIGTLRFEVSTPIEAVFQSNTGAIEGINQLGIFHTNGEPARFDWYELEYGRGFVADRGELIFSYPLQEGSTEFLLSGFADERPRVFEVSEDLVEITDFAYDATAGTVTFQDESAAAPHRYAVAGSAAWKRPTQIQLDAPGNLLAAGAGADWVTIYHRDFRDAAVRLARWRGADDRFGAPMRAKAIDVQDIYDEFSGGLLDPAAIRNFLAYAAANWDPAPMFVTLLGDGSYDYKNNSGTSPGNWIPPFQDRDSTYDDWYVRVEGGDDFPDMAIGRLTVQTAAEANALVDKIIAYDREPEVGPWQSRILMVSDDLVNPDQPHDVEGYFIIDSEFLSVRVMPQELDMTKLYLAQYPLEGRTKPRARDEFLRLFNEGALIMTYLGHGNPTVLAHESMFLVSRDLNAVQNGGRLPFFYTAASQVGVFDDPARISMPEALLKKTDGGVIGMISATRVGYHNSNMVLANQFHEQMYASKREHVPVGLALMEAKQMALSLFGPTDLAFRNMQRYSLFGDPATRLALPRYRVQIEVADSLSALGEVSVSGRILDPAGDFAASYQGQVWLQAFDSSVRSRLDGFSYQQVGAHMFRGRVAVVDGRFATAFRVPKDITYGGRNGRVSAYAWSDAQPAAYGSVGGLVLEGTAEGVEADLEGPEIALRFEGASGNTIPTQTTLHATITDPSGINITGETGHAIELAIDGEVFVLTDFYNSPEGDYRRGAIEFPLPELEPGAHEVRLKVWDNFNNSSRATVTVKVREGGDSGIANALFHPNPMRDAGGHFTYELKENMSAVRIQVFSLAGRLVDELDGRLGEGYNQVAWNPAADLANGTYLYKIAVERDSGSRSELKAALQVAK